MACFQKLTLLSPTLLVIALARRRCTGKLFRDSDVYFHKSRRVERCSNERPVKQPVFNERATNPRARWAFQNRTHSATSFTRKYLPLCPRISFWILRQLFRFT